MEKPPEEKKRNNALIGCLVFIAIAVIAVVIGVVIWAPWASKETKETNQDTEYLTWATAAAELLGNDFDACSSALDLGNMGLIAATSLQLYTDTGNALNEIDGYHVSADLAPSKNEFKLSLQDYRQAAWFTRQWALYGDLDDLIQATSYMNSGYTHLQNAIDLLPD